MADVNRFDSDVVTESAPSWRTELRITHSAAIPPSTTSVVPVVYDDAGLSR